MMSEPKCPKCGTTIEGNKSHTLIHYRTGYKCTKCGTIFSFKEAS